MSSDRHSLSSPRHRSLLSSSAAGNDAMAAATSAAASQVVMSHSQSSHTLSSSNVIDRTASSDEDTSLLFEDKTLWSSSFTVLYEFYQTGTFCDVEIHVGTQHINCHRLVLACFSKYFRYHTSCSCSSGNNLLSVPLL